MNLIVGAAALGAAATVALAALSTSASATTLNVLNSSFETGTPGAYSPPPTFANSWRFGCGSLGCGATGGAGIAAIGYAPDGAQVGYTTGGAGDAGSIAQDVTTIIPGATYTFSIMVGNPIGGGLTQYRVVLGYNTTPHDPSTNVLFADVLFSAPGDIPAAGAFQLVTLSAVAPLVATGDVTFAFGTGNGSTGYWDVASLSSTPTPAALPLFASGLGALGLIGWRRKRKTKLAI
jgi:hypothetical protein